MPIQLRVDCRLDSLVSERHKLVESGYFDRSLDAYGQQGKPCRRCGTLIVREQFMNRSSHFCPTCQKPPR
ncbi:hypothetical protein GCM10009763_09580 [Dermacoccus profundi]|uniref:FPG-type domain-containing protein n=2 Tax=Dermacoccus TaxID=57495 RepID=A0ABN2C6L9_9MICO